MKIKSILLYLIATVSFVSSAHAVTVRTHTGEIVYLKVNESLVVNKNTYLLSSYDANTQKDTFLISPVCTRRLCPNLVRVLVTGVADNTASDIQVLKADADGSLVTIPLSKH